MKQAWFVLQGDEEQGPIPAADLKRRAASGQLKAEDLVWSEGMEEWVAARSVPGLNFSAFAAPPLAPPPRAARSGDTKMGKRKYCSECGEPIRAQAEICPHCGVRQARVSSPANSPEQLRTWIKTTLLISAISNILLGLFWASFCIGIVFTVPMIILCVFEFSLWSRADTADLSELSQSAKTIGIFEIIVGLANTPTLVCGILITINASKLGRGLG